MQPNYPNNNYQDIAEPAPAPVQPVAPAPIKAKKPVGLIATVIVLLFAVCGLGAYVIMDFLNPAPTPSCPECPAVTSGVEVLGFFFDSTAVVYEGEVYVHVSGSTEQIDSNYGEGTYQALVATSESYQEYTFGDSSVLTNGSNFHGIKLDAENIIYVADYRFGQAFDPNYGLLLLAEDGTVSYISLLNLIRGVTTPVALEGLTDVTAFDSRNVCSEDGIGCGIATFAVTSEGTEIDLASYIPQQ